MGQPVSLILPAASGGQEPLSYSLESAPPGLEFDADTRALSGMPTTPGTFRLRYQVVDVDGDQDTQNIVVVVPVPDCEEWNTGTFFETATLERVTDCLWAGAEVNARDNRRNTPLHFAASATNDPLIIAAMLDAGADLRARNVDGAEPLHGAANNENPDITESLLAAGADVHAHTYSRRTALHWAARNNDNPTVIELLAAAGADVRAADNFGETPLHRAAQYSDNPAVIGALLEAGSELQAEHRLGGSPLHIAAAFNPNLEIISTLLDAGADLEARSNYGGTPFHVAAALSRNPAIIGALAAAGADVNARNDYGGTPLHSAAEYRDAVQLGGRSALILAAIVRALEAAVLRAAGAVCGGNSEFTDGSCQPGAQAAATSGELNLMYRELARAQAKFLEQSGVPDSAPGDSLWGTD